MHELPLMLALLTIGLLGGAVNSIAGGGTILLYPVLVALGVPPVVANGTTSVTVLPGTLSSAYGYRRFIRTIPRIYFWLLIPCLFGGLIGAWLLGQTSDETFKQIVPWFILGASILLALQGKLHSWLYSSHSRAFEKQHILVIGITSLAIVFLLAIYGGYYGGGFGIMMLAFLGLTPLTNINQMNGLKNLTAICMDIVAISYFSTHGLVDWRFLPLLLVGNFAGGWLGAVYGSRLPRNTIRWTVVAIGLVISAVLFANLH